MISLQQAADILTNNDNYAILTHQYPDGDTLGSAFALCRILMEKGKRAKVLINGELPKKFEYLAENLPKDNFDIKTVISVDVADSKLLGELNKYKGNVLLAVDHHVAHKPFAKNIYVDSTAAATAEIIYQLGELLDSKFSAETADCIYTGLTTDTGCFRYNNTTARTHNIAAAMIEKGCRSGKINKEMFETVSRRRMALENYVLSNIQYYADGKIAVIYTTKEILDKYGVSEDELEGLSAIPRQIQGVMIGITLREKSDTAFKISLRTNEGIDAGKICSHFGGGGHKAAAGCAIDGTLEDVIEKISKEAQLAL